MDPMENEVPYDGEAHEVEPSDHPHHHSAEDDRSHHQSGDGASPGYVFFSLPTLALSSFLCSHDGVFAVLTEKVRIFLFV